MVISFGKSFTMVNYVPDKTIWCKRPHPLGYGVGRTDAPIVLWWKQARGREAMAMCEGDSHECIGDRDGSVLLPWAARDRACGVRGRVRLDQRSAPNIWSWLVG